MKVRFERLSGWIQRQGGRRWAAIVGLLSAMVVGGCAGTPKEPPLTAEQRQLNLESFDYVWTTIRDKHWDPEMGGLDWAEVRDELRPRLEEAAVRSKARSVIGEMISRLGKSHYGIIPGELYEDLDRLAGEGSRDGATGIDVRVINGRALVTSVEEGSPAYDQGVRPGWEVIRVSDDELPPMLHDLAQALDGKTTQDYLLARAVSSRLEGSVGETVAVEFLDGDGAPVQLEIALAEKSGRKIRLGNLPAMYIHTDVRTIDENIGYIAFSGFFDPNNVMKIFNDAMVSFMDADGIIIDIRGNPGGIGPMAMGMAGWLVKEQDQHLGTMYTRVTELNFVVIPRAVTYDGPVAVLVDGLSGSTSEIFAGGLQDLGRARVFGTRTAGAALPSAIERLPNQDGFQYAVANYISEGGEVLEGRGVIPDVEVIPSREALLRGEDPVVRAAVGWIRDLACGESRGLTEHDSL